MTIAYRSVIRGTGACIPGLIKSNSDFTTHRFYDEHHRPIETPPQEVVEKFREITGIAERRYAPSAMNASDLATEAARQAIELSGIDPETLDHIIVAHNFGNVIKHTIQTDAVPSLASRVKHNLGIHQPNCVAYDLLFGCPGWVQGLIQADAFFKAGLGTRALIIGAETLSRVIDDYDRDSMIFSDGAGACVLEYQAVDAETGPGMLQSAAVTHSVEEAYYIGMGKSYFPESDPRIRYIKMKGRKVYEYAMQHVPQAMKACWDKTGLPVEALKKVFLHQANEKMDEGIIKRMYKLYGQQPPEAIMPMSIHLLGNSSVATVPTLLHTVWHGLQPGHALHRGDAIMLASVGAGMNVNAVCYRM